MNSPLSGIIPPLVTPLQPDGELDREALSRLVDRVVQGGVAGVFVLGTTGEGPGLSGRLRRELVAGACEAVDGRAQVLVGVTDTSLEEALDLAEFSQACGASAVVAAAPYYFPITQPELARYFLALADDAALPLYLYNMPACVGMSIEMSTLALCARSSKILGIKDSSGDMAYFREALRMKEVRPDWSVLVGPEGLLAEATLAGGDGGVHGGGNLAPELFVAQFAAARRRDEAAMSELQQRIDQLGQIYQVAAGFMGVARGVKCALNLLGVCGETMTPPFEPCDDAQRRAISACLRLERSVAAV